MRLRLIPPVADHEALPVQKTAGLVESGERASRNLENAQPSGVADLVLVPHVRPEFLGRLREAGRRSRLRRNADQPTHGLEAPDRTRRGIYPFASREDRQGARLSQDVSPPCKKSARG